MLGGLLRLIGVAAAALISLSDRVKWERRDQWEREQAARATNIEPTTERIVRARPKYCAECGDRLAVSAKYCPECGTRVLAGPA